MKIKFLQTIIGILLILVAISVYSGCWHTGTLGIQKINVGGTTVYVEIADEPHERERGLQKRKKLPPDRGMLFVYPQEQMVQFWMKETSIPLDIAFITEKKNIVEIYHMYPEETKRYRSKQKVQYALEVNQNWFSDNSVTIGDAINFPVNKRNNP
ncbi:MAG: DUF192 domain-containing protein [Candidatus Omnitrophica bacterium]|nr:DUF192 domain-containing protein [Candidatus Omnitrophota bacterium]